LKKKNHPFIQEKLPLSSSQKNSDEKKFIDHVCSRNYSR